MELISNITTIVVGLGGLGIAFYTLRINKDLIFKDSIRNKQIEELCSLREILFDILFDVYFVKEFAIQIKSLNLSLAEFEKSRPEDWDQFQRFRSNCMGMFYKLQFPKHYLIPKWVEFEKFRSLQETNKGFTPFTIHVLMDKEQEEVMEWQNEILSAINYIDAVLGSKA